MKISNFIGDRKFYRSVLAVSIPIMVQNGITTLVSLLDNIMVGRIGNEEMSGVSIANQLIFVFTLCIFGAMSGPGIFAAQYYGKGDNDGLRYSVRYKAYIGIAVTAVAILVFGFFGKPLMEAFLYESETGGDLSLTLEYSLQYMKIMLFGLLPFAVTQIYATTLRETGNTRIPMLCGMLAVAVNIILNYILIYGKLGAPRLGVEGAAIATVVSRFTEGISIIIWTHKNLDKNIFMRGVYKSLYIPSGVAKSVTIKSIPLLINEALWSLGVTVLTQCYATRGLDVVGAYNISSTISNLFSVVFLALGSAIAIIVGNLLGASRLEEARISAYRLITFALVSSIVVGVLMALTAPLFPKIYKTTDSVKDLSVFFIYVLSAYLPLRSALHAMYFTIRSGGKTFITFVFDSGFSWLISVPVAFALTRLTNWTIYPIFIICNALELIKCAASLVLVKSGAWITNFVGEKQ